MHVMKYLHCNKYRYTWGIRINAKLVKEGSFRINAKLVKEELKMEFTVSEPCDVIRVSSLIHVGAFLEKNKIVIFLIVIVPRIEVDWIKAQGEITLRFLDIEDASEKEPKQTECPHIISRVI